MAANWPGKLDIERFPKNKGPARTNRSGPEHSAGQLLLDFHVIPGVDIE
jgi:hypothetical protein